MIIDISTQWVDNVRQDEIDCGSHGIRKKKPFYFFNKHGSISCQNLPIIPGYAVIGHVYGSFAWHDLNESFIFIVCLILANSGYFIPYITYNYREMYEEMQFDELDN